jgi:hypothetical protein
VGVSLFCFLPASSARPMKAGNDSVQLSLTADFGTLKID